MRHHRVVQRLFTLGAMCVLLATAGCGDKAAPGREQRAVAAAIAGSRPIGRGPRFVPPAPMRPVAGCRRRLGRRYAAHIELFAADRVVLVPAGVGTDPPRATAAGRVVRARCYGSVVTLEPTGVVLVAARTRATAADLFRAWGEPLARDGFASFRGRVRAYLNGRRWPGSPQTLPLGPHAIAVLEIGPYVPPHSHYRFPPGS